MLAGKSYVPILKTGIAEISAYRNLYDDVKQVTLPFFQLRPWPNAKHLAYSIEKIVDAVSNFPFILGLDASRLNHPSPLPAQTEFNGLFDPAGGFQRYYEFVESVPGASPVIIPIGAPENVVAQISNAGNLGRGLVVHQRRGSDLEIISTVAQVHYNPSECTFILDGGWSTDYIALESWCLPRLVALHEDLSAAEFVIACSSFPDSFSHIIGNAEEMGSERRLFNVVRQQFNQLDLTYGDWGSTRTSNSGGGGYIPSRVDVPKLNSWEIFRADPDNDLGFSEMAWEAQHHDSFPSTPNCWGKEMIQVTNDEGEGINSRPDAIKVRINIHMTIQSGATSVPPTDEVPYTD